MLLRWIGTHLDEATRGFHCVRGLRDMKHLCSALLQRVRADSHDQLKVA